MQERLKAVRKSMKLTQRQFADLIGVSRDVVASWEIGRVQPSEAILRLICRGNRISYAWLKYGEGEMTDPKEADDAEKLARILESGSPFIKAFLCGLADLPEEAWEQMETFMAGLQRKTDH